MTMHNDMKRHNNIATHVAKAASLMALAVVMNLPVGAAAQEGLNIPFSQFGLGSNELYMPFAERMGGAILTSSGNNYINPYNPASYAGIERESFVFDMGINLQLNHLRQGDAHKTNGNGNLGYLAIGLPLTGWWKLGAGLQPYSTVNYLMYSSTNGSAQTEYYGTGGVNRIFVGTAFNIPAGKTTKLQIGFNANYLNGTIERSISHNFSGNETSYYIPSRKYKNTRVNNFTFDAGLQMWQQLSHNMKLGVALTYKPYMDLTVTDEALIYTFAADQSLVDTVFPAPGQPSSFKSRMEQAQTVGAGVSLQMGKHWLIAFDANFASWSGMKYTEDTAHAIFGTNTSNYGPTSRYALGIERIGDMDANTYWGRIGWSLGANIGLDVLRITIDGQDYSLDSWGIGAGISMPMRKGQSLLTFSMSYNSIGTAEVLRRDVFTLGIAISSCERWFVKRKYN